MIDDDLRPDPDALLAQANESHRGKLKIFFGASAGVGKTYSMLQEAQRIRAQGLDVIIGIIETHDRADTAELTIGLEQIPLKAIEYRDRQLKEFDLDAALARHPAIILVDELAHSNAPGSRHPKRWQDIEELLDAGIDVFTTVNVQHLESLNDIVGSITGIHIKETIPDHVFDQANEVVLVDLPPDDLRQRLHEGKVYLGEQAERAIDNFFRKGNLIALRELALRCTADRVDEQMRVFREGSGQERVWYTRDALLVCISQRPGNEKLVRIAARMAARFGCAWYAVYVETPNQQHLPASQRLAVLNTLKLAQDLGAETASLMEPNKAQAILNYAREHNLSKVIIGRHPESYWWRPATRFVDRLSRLGPELDLIIISVDRETDTLPARAKVCHSPEGEWKHSIKGYAGAITVTGVITMLTSWAVPHFNQHNVAMIYLLGVVMIALFFGRLPSVLCAIVSVLCFDLFFVSPYFSFTIADIQYLVTFIVMLLVGLIVGNLTANMRYQAQIARHREQRVRHMYEISKMLSRALSREDIAKTITHFLSSSFATKVALLLPDKQGVMHQILADEIQPMQVDLAIARWCYDNNAPAGTGTDTLPGTPYQLQPLNTSQQVFGVLAFQPAQAQQLMIPEQQRLLQAYCVMIATALERLHLTFLAQESRLDAAREQLRNSLLTSLSHDLRTPLTVLFSQAEILTLDLAAEGSAHAQQANEIRQEVLNTTRLMINLLDMAQLQSGGFHLDKGWYSLQQMYEEVVDTLEPLLHSHQVEQDLPATLPLIHCDYNLLQRALLNLVENAAKYAGKNATIGIRAQSSTEWVTIEIWDSGPGIDEEQLLSIFDKFSRGHASPIVPGVGLGLAICRAIIDLHGGRIWASNRPNGGAAFHIMLPLKEPGEG